MDYLLVIKADTNDADYISECSEISQKCLDELMPIIKLVKSKHDWPMHDYVRRSIKDIYPELTEDQILNFSDLCPRGEHGIHSIESIKIYPLAGPELKI